MIFLAALTISFLNASPSERVYRVTASARAGSQVTLRVNAPNGWIAAFCTVSMCARDSVTTAAPPSGTVHVELHLYKNGRPQPGMAVVTDNLGQRGIIEVPYPGG